MGSSLGYGGQVPYLVNGRNAHTGVLVQGSIVRIDQAATYPDFSGAGDTVTEAGSEILFIRPNADVASGLGVIHDIKGITTGTGSDGSGSGLPGAGLSPGRDGHVATYGYTWVLASGGGTGVTAGTGIEIAADFTGAQDLNLGTQIGWALTTAAAGELFRAWVNFLAIPDSA